MPEIKAPEYPARLTVKNWNKNKGFWAKIVGKTGVSELMKSGEKAWDAVHWDRFELQSLMKLEGSAASEATLDNLRSRAEKELPLIKKVQQAADKIEERAREVHEEFKQNKIIRKSSTAHVKEVAEDAKGFSEALSTKAVNKFLQSQYNLGLEVVTERKEEKVKSMAAMYKALDGAEARLKGVATRTDFGKFFQSYLTPVIKEFGVLFSIIPSLKDIHKEFLRTCGAARMPTSDEEVPERMERIGPLLKNIRKKMTDFEKA